MEAIQVYRLRGILDSECPLWELIILLCAGLFSYFFTWETIVYQALYNFLHIRVSDLDVKICSSPLGIFFVSFHSLHISVKTKMVALAKLGLSQLQLKHQTMRIQAVGLHCLATILVSNFCKQLVLSHIATTGSYKQESHRNATHAASLVVSFSDPYWGSGHKTTSLVATSVCTIVYWNWRHNL